MFCQVATADANKTRAYAVVPAAGSFQVYLDPLPAVQVAINFIVLN